MSMREAGTGVLPASVTPPLGALYVSNGPGTNMVTDQSVGDFSILSLMEEIEFY